MSWNSKQVQGTGQKADLPRDDYDISGRTFGRKSGHESEKNFDVKTECLTISCNNLNMDSCFKGLIFLPIYLTLKSLN